MSDEYKTILSSVRPARVCVLIDRTDSDWQDSCLRIIEFFTALWGGEYNIIVPTDGETISEAFWRILETYDPDYLFRYVKTGGDFKASKPDEYKSHIEKETDRFVASNPGADRDLTRKFIDEGFEHAPFGQDPMPNPSLQEQIKRRLAPFWFNNYVVDPGAIYAGSTGSHQLTSIAAILPDCDYPPILLSPAVSLSGIPPLWHAAKTGLLHANLIDDLLKTKVQVITQDFREDDRCRFMRYIMTGLNEAEIQPATTAVFPFRLSMTEVGLYRSLQFRHWEEPALVIAGETIDDFCLYYCLSRLRENVNWLLPAWVSRFHEAETRAKSGHEQLPREDLTATWFLHHIQELTQYGRRAASLFSASIPQTDLLSLKDAILGASLSDSTNLNLEVREREPAIIDSLRFPLIAYEKENYPRDVTKHFTNDEITGFFDTPKPKKFKPINPREHRWITELSIVQHHFPQHAAIGAWILPNTALGTSGVRCGRNGVAYFCPNFLCYGDDIDTFLIRPKVRTPNAFEIFHYLAAQQRATCKLSDKGFYAEDSVRKFGGLEQLAAFLRDERRSAVLDKFLDRNKPRPGVNDEGVLLTDDRRYLNLPSIARILGTAEDASKLIDDMISARVFYRGFIFKCAFCRNADWFSVDEIAHDFKCKRCGRRQVYTHNHWREPEEPAWYYQLDELVYQGCGNDMAVPLLALDYLRRNAGDSFLYSNELEFFKPDATTPFLESDICCIPSGVLTVGEAKKGNRLGENATDEAANIERYGELCNLLAPRQVVFATIAPAWSDATRARIEEAFQGGIVRPVLLTKSELLSS